MTFLESFKQKILTLWPWRIWQQIFVMLVPLVIIPLTALGILLIHTSQTAVKTSVLRDHRELAVRAASEVNEFVKKPKELLMTAAAILGVLHADRWRQETAIVELALQYPMFRRIAYLDPDGQETVISDLGGPKYKKGDDPCFLKAMAGESCISGINILGNSIPIVIMSVPVRGLGKVRGVLTAEVNLRGMWDIVDGIRIGKTGRVNVFDKFGMLLYHPNKRYVMEHKLFPYQTVVESLFSGRTGSREETDRQGNKSLVSFSPIEETGWGLVVLQSAKEAYAFSKIMKIQSWVLILISIAAALLISLALARFMSRPIHMLLEGTRRIARSDFDHPITVSRRDEIGHILNSFNRITVKLQKAQHMEKLSLIGKAAASIAHELRNSLVLVNTYIQLLPERYQEKKFIEEFTRIVPQELDIWKGMLKDMIEYSKSRKIAMEEIDVNVFINDTAALLKVRAEQEGIDFTVHVHHLFPSILGDMGKLRYVFFNLVSNAMKATSSGGSIILSAHLVSSSKEWEQEHIMIQVEDTGKGIPDEEIGKIFDPFSSGKGEGLGLGLAISKETVERHHGRIEVVSQEGKGTSFTVRLPVKNTSSG